MTFMPRSFKPMLVNLYADHTIDENEFPELSASRVAELLRKIPTTYSNYVSWSEKRRRVAAIQARLRTLGYNPGPIDGLPGPRTDSAISLFKASVGLRARPLIGPLTYKALFHAPAQSERLPWMHYAIMLRGLHEVRDYSALKKAFSKSVSWIDPREIPWCGAFVATCMRSAYPNIPIPDNPLGARNWKDFGVNHDPVYGSVLVFWRGSKDGWKGHVGFYYGEDATAYHVLGGNQSNAVTVTRVSKTRLITARMPNEHYFRSGTSQYPRKILLAPNGRPLSYNEA